MQSPSDPDPPTGLLLSQLRPLIEELHRAGPARPLYSLHVTGGGVSAVQWLLTVPGAGRGLQAVRVPYARQALREAIGAPLSLPFSYCSEGSCLALAKGAYEEAVAHLLGEHRALLLPPSPPSPPSSTPPSPPSSSPSDPPAPFFCPPSVFGVGVSCALSTGGEGEGGQRGGRRRAYLSLYSPSLLRTFSLSFGDEKEGRGRGREGEDALVSLLLLDLLERHLLLGEGEGEGEGEGGGRAAQLVRERLREGDSLSYREHRPLNPLSALLSSQRGEDFLLTFPQPDAPPGAWPTFCSFPLFSPFPSPPLLSATPSFLQRGEEGRRVVFPGSFAPLHRGHVSLLSSALSLLENEPPSPLSPSPPSSPPLPLLALFELSLFNADKPPLSLPLLLERLAPFGERGALAPLQGRPVGLLLSKQSLFRDKARLVPRSVFVVGGDTLLRLLDLKYYRGERGGERAGEGEGERGEEGEMESVLKLGEVFGEMHRQHGCSLLVGGRALSYFPPALQAQARGAMGERGGDFLTLQALREGRGVEGRLLRALGGLHPHLLRGLGERDFRADVSSTEIRKEREKRRREQEREREKT